MLALLPSMLTANVKKIQAYLLFSGILKAK